MDRQTIIENIIEFLKEKCNPEAIILFGSYARNEQREDSDIDIAIKTSQNIDKTQIFCLQNELSERLKKEIDLLNLDDITDGIRYEILINGETIFVKDSYHFDLYKLRKYSDYLELNESRKDMINTLKEGESVYGE